MVAKVPLAALLVPRSVASLPERESIFAVTGRRET